MRKINIHKIILMFMSIGLLVSCKKYLDQKPSIFLHVPDTIEDFQALLDNNTVINQQMGTSLIESIADDYYVSSKDYQNVVFYDRDNYIWKPDALELENWRLAYEYPIHYSNLVIDGISRIKDRSNQASLNNIEGSALFIRAFTFFHLAQLYCKPYSINNKSEPGIVLRLTANIESKSSRATVEDSYMRILNDTKRATFLLPNIASTSMRPTKPAAYALLARVYLTMGNFVDAEKYADSALAIKGQLLDYKTLAPSSNPVLPTFDKNIEIIYFSVLRSSEILSNRVVKIDSNLYSSYNENDLRKQVFFQQNTNENKGTYHFKGSYFTRVAGQFPFNGLTTSELYLIKAECLIRKSNKNEALAWLNTLLKSRWKSGFTDYSVSTLEEARKLIFNERRKELVFRGLRWSDLRRFNIEGAGLTLKRIVNGAEYTLPPNDPRTVLLIPLEEISRSGIPQNQR